MSIIQFPKIYKHDPGRAFERFVSVRASARARHFNLSSTLHFPCQRLRILVTGAGGELANITMIAGGVQFLQW